MILLLKRIIEYTKSVRLFMSWLGLAFPNRSKFGKITPTTLIEYPCMIGNPSKVYCEEMVKLRHNLTIINTIDEKVIVKKYSVIAPRCTIITNSHRSTIGIPHFILGESHINDKSGSVIINEDVWIGANTTILAGVTIGRGAIIGASSLVTKDVPPYALVVGSPAKIIGVKFSKNGIIKHEKLLYRVDEQIKYEELEVIFSTYFNKVKVFGTESSLSIDELQRVNEIKEKWGMFNIK